MSETIQINTCAPKATSDLPDQAKRFGQLVKDFSPEGAARMTENAKMKVQKVQQFKEKANQKASEIIQMINELRGMFAEAKGSFNNDEGFHNNKIEDYVQDFSPHVEHMN